MKLPTRNQTLAALIACALLLACMPERYTLVLRRQMIPVANLLRGAVDYTLLALHDILPQPPEKERDPADEANRELEMRNVSLENRVTELQILLDDMADIQGLLEAEQSRHHPLPSRILIRHDLAQVAQSIVIDKGRNDGVLEGMPVVRNTTVVGVVERAGSGSSVVRLLTDVRFRAAAMGMNSRVQGILRGTGTRSLDVRFVSQDEPMELGERVLTSGLDGVFPKGFLLGTIRDLSDPDQNKELDFDIEPALRFTDLEFVVVLRPSQ